MALRELLAVFDVQIPTAKIAAGGKAVDKLADQLKGYAKFYSSAEIVQGARSFVDGLVQQATQLQDTSDQLGLSTRELQQWGLAANLSGSSGEDLSRGLVKLQQNAEAGADVFRTLGVATEDASGNAKPTAQLFREVGLAIGKIKDPSERTKRALEALGKPGVKLAPMFAGGAEGLDSLLGELERLGGGLTEDAIRSINDYDDAMVRWNVRTLAVKGALARELFPALEMVATKIGETVSAFTKGERGADRLKIVLGILGTAGAIAGLQMLAPWLPLVALLTAAYLVVDDLVVALKGGDAVSKDLLDTLFGKGTGASVFAAIRADLEQLQERMRDKGPAEAFGEAFSEMGASIVTLFADEIPQGVRDAYDAAANGIATSGQKSIITFVESVKSAILGLPVYFATAAIDAGKRFLDTLRNSTSEGVVGIAGDIGKAFSEALAGAIKVPSLDFLGGPRGDLSGQSVNADGSPTVAAPGVFGTAARALAGPASALFASTGTTGPTINQTINQTINTEGPFARGDIRAGIDDANEAALSQLEATA